MTPPPMTTTRARAGIGLETLADARSSTSGSRGSATRHLLEEGGEPAGAEGGGGLLVALDAPGAEVEVDRAGGLLDEAPERPAVLAAQRLDAHARAVRRRGVAEVRLAP